MRIYRILTLSLIMTAVFPQLAGAKLSKSPKELGGFEAAMDSCAQVNPDSAAKYKEIESASVADATKEELDKARSTKEYKDAYDSMSKEGSKMPKADLLKACTSGMMDKAK